MEYHKIETLFDRDKETFKVIKWHWRTPEFEYLSSNQWIFTEKVDGTNIRVIWDKQKVRFGGKTDNAAIPAFLLSVLQDTFTEEKFKLLYPDTSMILYGEGYGARIQKGGGNYKKDGTDFVLFDVLIDKWWLKREDVFDISLKLGIKNIPIIGSGTLSEAVKIAQEGFKSHWGDFLAEGIVVRPEVELFTRNHHRIIGKIKHNDFVGSKETRNEKLRQADSKKA